ncbi:hypothetical protein V494_01665 [Pseudogymnoascus sp. VKM F-4513 (FW-928)]|nr:hypothetical protein V494_01665 [Pseudogymnoascus sp. VKM F-4513 (FW-928)]
MASLISNECGRLGVWGSNSGADRQGRGSLDDQLRNDSTVHNMVAQSLKSLHSCITQGIELAKNPAKPLGENEEFDIPDGMSDFGSEASSVDSSQDTSPIDSVLAAIIQQVQALYESSTLLRRPAVPDKYIRSVTKNISSISNMFGPWDIAHVLEKVTQWHAENERKLEEPLKANDWLCVRLGAGNTRRREQLSYWQGHPGQGSSTKINAEIFSPAQNVSQKFVVDPTTVLVSPTPAKIVAHSTSASDFTTHSFSAVAQSVLKDTATISGRPKTIYASSDYRPEATEIRLPDFPKTEKGAVTVSCPYCFIQLDVKEMDNQRDLWKKHVFRDLRPYQCTWEHCSHSDKLYVTRHDWIFHEMQIHRRQWTCRDCDENFKSKTSIENHLRSRHLGTFTEKQLPMLLNLCEREIEPNTPTGCPLCEKILPLASLRGDNDLQGHLAWHLEQIALFVISKSDADEASGADEAESNKAAPGGVDDAEAAQLLGLNKDTEDSGNNQTEGDQIPTFPGFAPQERTEADKLRSSKTKANKENKEKTLEELKAFASSFKLSTTPPNDLAAIITKDPAKNRSTDAILDLSKLDEEPTEAQIISRVQDWTTGSASVTEAKSQLENNNHDARETPDYAKSTSKGGYENSLAFSEIPRQDEEAEEIRQYEEDKEMQRRRQDEDAEEIRQYEEAEEMQRRRQDEDAEEIRQYEEAEEMQRRRQDEDAEEIRQYEEAEEMQRRRQDEDAEEIRQYEEAEEMQRRRQDEDAEEIRQYEEAEEMQRRRQDEDAEEIRQYEEAEEMQRRRQDEDAEEIRQYEEAEEMQRRRRDEEAEEIRQYEEAEEMQRRRQDEDAEEIRLYEEAEEMQRQRRDEEAEEIRQYEGAEVIQRRDLADKVQVLGVEHIDTLRSMSQLASVLSFQGNYEEAETFYRLALEGKSKVIGVEHPETLISMSELAAVLFTQDKKVEAEVLYSRALEEKEKVYGIGHRDTFSYVFNLQMVLESQGKHEQSRELQKRIPHHTT